MAQSLEVPDAGKTGIPVTHPIVVILSLIVILGFCGCSDRNPNNVVRKRAKIARTVNVVRSHAAAVMALLMDVPSLSMGRALDTKDLPAVLVENPGLVGWSGPYIDKTERSIDDYGRPLVFLVETGAVVVVSVGEDGFLGTSDDIRSVVPYASPRPRQTRPEGPHLDKRQRSVTNATDAAAK